MSMTSELKARCQKGESELIARAVLKYNKSSPFGKICKSEIIRAGSLELARKILSTKEIKIEGS